MNIFTKATFISALLVAATVIIYQKFVEKEVQKLL